MQVKLNLLYVGSSCYSFKSKEDGKLLEGAKLQAIQLADDKKDTDTRLGLSVTDFKADYALFDKFKVLKPLQSYEFVVDVVLDGNKKEAVILDVVLPK